MPPKKVLLIGQGYIGSYLAKSLCGAGYDLTSCDQSFEKNIGSRCTDIVASRYQDLNGEFLAQFGVILWFAGHSSVPASIADPEGALANNCLDLFSLAKTKPAKTRLIYASTGSIYSFEHTSAGSEVLMLSETETRLNPVNPYDCSKIAFDAMATCFVEGATGIRLGTMCGYGEKLRKELIFNSMNLSAITSGEVGVANPHASRGILFLDDLAFYVRRLIEIEAELPKILNAASYNITVGALGTQIADFHKVPIKQRPDSKTYSFQMNCNAIRNICGAPPERTIAERCSEFKTMVMEGVL